MTAGMRWCVVAVALAAAARAERWQWPERAPSGRVDSKLLLDQGKSQPSQPRFLEGVQVDLPFQEPTDTEGFYNRPLGEGRYPVRVEEQQVYMMRGLPHTNARRTGGRQLTADGTLDSLQYCKCVSSPNCRNRMDPVTEKKACGPNQYLCCYQGQQQYPSSQLFNELSEERPVIYPARPNDLGPFPPSRGEVGSSVFGPEQTPDVLLIPAGGRPDSAKTKDILVGPAGPTGIIGPNKPIFDGPEGVLTGTPTLAGPLGPTGIIGPIDDQRKKNYLTSDLGTNESAQRGVLVGPGGPTGMIGPAYYNRPVLVGPDGPTGIIGPRGRYPVYRGGVLVGPDGPSGSIGPSRGILTGPGGPTGRIGPWGYGCGHHKCNASSAGGCRAKNKKCYKDGRSCERKVKS